MIARLNKLCILLLKENNIYDVVNDNTNNHENININNKFNVNVLELREHSLCNDAEDPSGRRNPASLQVK